MRTLLRIFFHFLYHQFAFAYDLVAATVSFGHWNNWIQEVLPFITGTQTLEIGHGPGHLQRILLDRGLDSVAIDESSAMGRLAKKNVVSIPDAESAITQPPLQLTRGLAQELPFASESFNTVISTFPAEYIADPRTLLEVRRCLSDGGRFIVLPVAMPKNGFLKWLYKVTGETPSNALEIVHERMEHPFTTAGFVVETKLIERTSGTLVIIVATKD